MLRPARLVPALWLLLIFAAILNHRPSPTFALPQRTRNWSFERVLTSPFQSATRRSVHIKNASTLRARLARLFGRFFAKPEPEDPQVAALRNFLMTGEMPPQEDTELEDSEEQAEEHLEESQVGTEFGEELQEDHESDTHAQAKLTRDLQHRTEDHGEFGEESKSSTDEAQDHNESFKEFQEGPHAQQKLKGECQTHTEAHIQSPEDLSQDPQFNIDAQTALKREPPTRSAVHGEFHEISESSTDEAQDHIELREAPQSNAYAQEMLTKELQTGAKPEREPQTRIQPHSKCHEESESKTGEVQTYIESPEELQEDFVEKSQTNTQAPEQSNAQPSQDQQSDPQSMQQYTEEIEKKLGQLDTGFTVGLVGTAAIVPLEIWYLWTHFDQVRRRSVHLNMLGAVLVVITLLRVMRSKYSRQQLSSVTFKVISVCLLMSFGIMSCDTLLHIVRLATGAPDELSHAGRIAMLTSLWCCLTGIITTATAAKGLSVAKNMKTAQITSQNSQRGILMTWIGGGLVVLAVEQAFLGADILMYSRFTDLGALRFLTVSAAAFCCYNAMIGGTSFLTLRPYRMLSLALFVDNVLHMITTLSIRQPWEMALAAVGICSSFCLWAYGTYCKWKVKGRSLRVKPNTTNVMS